MAPIRNRMLTWTDIPDCTYGAAACLHTSLLHSLVLHVARALLLVLCYVKGLSVDCVDILSLKLSDEED